MSELRDLTAALRAQSARMTDTQECLLVVLRNSEQEAVWRHEQRNANPRLALDELVKSLKQLENFQEALWKYLGKLDDRQENIEKTRHADISEVKARLRALEKDEVTQA